MLIFILIANALALFATAWLIPGIDVADFPTALIAAAVLGLLNTFLRPLLSLLALPVTVVTLGLFSWIISAVVLWLTSLIVPGFVVDGFLQALVGGVVLAFIAALLHSLVKR
ncbi:hypothetical protein CMO96_04765 [Candidatus Woesebacteria bacterium]|nr:hypothetical protein [Candidatus Woesebacteria bacterium]